MDNDIGQQAGQACISPKCESQVKMEMNRLKDVLNSLSDRNEVLSLKLITVLKEQMSEEQLESKKLESPKVQLAYEIGSISEGFAHEVEKIQDILDRLEL